MFNVLIAIGTLIPLLYLWVPTTGLEGAAYAVGTAYTVQNLIQVLQVRHLTGRWHYRADVAWIILISIVAFASLEVSPGGLCRRKTTGYEGGCFHHVLDHGSRVDLDRQDVDTLGVI